MHPHVEIKLVDAGAGDVVGRGTQGELCTRGYSVMLGYWQDPARTAEVIDNEGWMHTGDLAVMDADGYVEITGRVKDVIIRGGENISPREVEELLHGHPSIAEAHVVGVPDDRLGEEVMAWVRLRRGHDLEVSQLRVWCRARIAHFKVPKHWRVVDEFPMTVTGKVQKYKLRERAKAMISAGETS